MEKFGSDTRGDFIFINKLGSSAIDYALALCISL
jgi:hypothetical protein